MKTINNNIDFKEVTRRIEKEMEGYSPSAWAEKIGVKINVVSNVHGSSARQKPSLNYIIAVSVATRKPVDYFLWGNNTFLERIGPRDERIKDDANKYPEEVCLIPPPPNPEMGKRVKYWREDMGLSIAEMAKRTGLPVDTIKRIEAGFHTTTDVIVKIADTLRCSTDFLLGCGCASISQLHRIEKT